MRPSEEVLGRAHEIFERKGGPSLQGLPSTIGWLAAVQEAILEKMDKQEERLGRLDPEPGGYPG